MTSREKTLIPFQFEIEEELPSVWVCTKDEAKERIRKRLMRKVNLFLQKYVDGEYVIRDLSHMVEVVHKDVDWSDCGPGYIHWIHGEVKGYLILRSFCTDAPES